MEVQTRLEDFGAGWEGPTGYRCRYCGRVFSTERGLNSHITRVHFDKDVPAAETLFTYERVETEEGPGKRAVLKIHMDRAMLRDLMRRATEFGYPFDVFIFKLLNIALAPTADEMEKIVAALAKETGQDIFSPITHTLYKGGTGEPVKIPRGPPAEVGPYIS